MDKNTIWAIVLSSIVLIGSLVVNQIFILPRQQAAQARQAAEQEIAQAEREEAALMASNQISTDEFSSSESLTETEYTITTNKVKVTFTNKGGDIISYKLLEHLDKDTNSGVEMVDNVTANNRAFSLSFGDSNGSILNELFNVRENIDGDPNKIGFYRTYSALDSKGESHSFMLAKLYTFKPDEYVFKLDITVRFDDGKELSINDAAYSLRTSPQIGPHYDKKNNRYEVRQFLSLNGGKRTRKNISSHLYDKPYDWAGVAGKYFAMLVKPSSPTDMSTVLRTSVQAVNGYENAQLFLTRNAINDSSVTDSYYIYVGPRSERQLIKYNSKDKNDWGLVNAKFDQSLQTSGLFSIIEVALKWGMEKINLLVHNWGISIIILTIILKIILFPLNKSSALGTLKMQDLQPKMQVLQEKYKNNQQKLSEEMSKLYKEAGYNPASGCLPMVLQMIILFSLYNVFNNYFEFRGASFIHGWIDDLSVGDSIWSWEKQIPILSSFTQNNLRILPFAYTIFQLLNGKITQYGGAGAGNPQSQAQMKFMMYGMPILFFFMFYNVPSGLLIYWTVSNVLQIGQQLVINKIMAGKRAELKKNQTPVNKNAAKFKGGKKKNR
mgnify:CR=1 FL=1